jgi:hypothetical protein
VEAGEGDFESMCLDNIEEDENPGVAYTNNGDTPSPEDYNDMLMANQPDENDKEASNNKYLNIKLIMDMGTSDEWHGRVIQRSWGLDGEPIGCAHNTPFFNTREYEVELTHKKHQANVIAQNMYAQVDNKEKEFQLLKGNHRSQEWWQCNPDCGQHSLKCQWHGKSEEGNPRLVPTSPMEGWNGKLEKTVWS